MDAWLEKKREGKKKKSKEIKKKFTIPSGSIAMMAPSLRIERPERKIMIGLFLFCTVPLVHACLIETAIPSALPTVTFALTMSGCSLPAPARMGPKWSAIHTGRRCGHCGMTTGACDPFCDSF